MNSVLIVDDDPSVLRLLSMTFEAEGWAVFRASSGEATLDMLLNVIPDVIVLDLGLPDINGEEVYRRMCDAGYGGPVLVLSAANNARAVASRLGVAFVSKPFDPGQLIAIAQGLAGSQAAWGSLQGSGQLPGTSGAARPYP
jgi:two-component system KDP operon response regulator KdpE